MSLIIQYEKSNFVDQAEELATRLAWNLSLDHDLTESTREACFQIGLSILNGDLHRLERQIYHYGHSPHKLIPLVDALASSLPASDVVVLPAVVIPWSASPNTSAHDVGIFSLQLNHSARVLSIGTDSRIGIHVYQIYHGADIECFDASPTKEDPEKLFREICRSFIASADPGPPPLTSF